MGKLKQYGSDTWDTLSNQQKRDFAQSKGIYNMFKDYDAYRGAWEQEHGLDLEQRATGLQRQTTNVALAQQQRAMRPIAPAFQQARTATTQGYQTAIQNALRDVPGLESQAQQAVGARGLYHSTIMQNANIGISSALSARLAQIDQAFAQRLGSLNVQEAQALSGLKSLQAQTAGGAASSAYGGYRSIAEAIASQRYDVEDPDAWLNSLLGIGATVGTAAIL